jgi:hypothetical protein
MFEEGAMNEETKDFAFELLLLRNELEAARKVVEIARAIVSSEGPPTDNDLTALRSELALYDAIVAKQHASDGQPDSAGETSND